MSDPPPPPAKGGTSIFKIIFGTAIGGCVCLMLGLGACVIGAGVVAKKAKEKQAAAAKAADALPVAAVEWDEIEATYGPKAGTTGLQKQEKWRELKGKKVRWTGAMLGVHKILGQLMMQVRVNPEATLRQLLQSDVFVTIRATEDQLSKARALEQGASVTFEGVLDRHHVKLGKRWAMITLIHGKLIE